MLWIKQGPNGKTTKGNEMSEFDINQVLEDASGSIKEAATKELQAQVISAIRWNLSEEIQKMAQSFFDTEIKPEIAAMLTENKAIIVQNVLDGLGDIGVSVAEELKKQALKNIETNYKLSKIVDNLFG